MADIAVTDPTADKLFVLQGSPSGTSSTAVSFTTGLTPVAVASADFNGDGHPDILTLDTNSNGLSIFLDQPQVFSLFPASLPSGSAGSSYEQVFIATGGVAPYEFTVSAGSLPPGLTLSSAGVLSGQPTAPGAYSFTVKVADGSGCTTARAYQIGVCASIMLAPGELPNGVVGTAYSQLFTASGGVSPYTYTVTSGALPPGLALSGSGALAGTPSATGLYGFTVTATDAATCGGSSTYTIVISAGATNTSLISSPNPSLSGQAVTLTATVLPVIAGSGTPTGSVRFLDGTTLLGSVSLSGSTAVLSTSSLTVGSHSITAAYQGDAHFGGSVSSAVNQQVGSLGGCSSSDPTLLCVQGARFRVQVAWKNQFASGATGVGTAVAVTPDSGYFWFFSASNVELIVKVLDGRQINGSFWFLYGALSNVEYTITVTDTVKGVQKTYHNPPGTLASVADTTAFAP